MTLTTGYASITFPSDFTRQKKVVFHAGTRFDFRPGLNLLVGDQGAGKSTILQLLREWSRAEQKQSNPKLIADAKEQGVIIETVGQGRLYAFDFEQDNPRVGETFKEGMDFGAQILMRWMSHGQCTRVMLDNLAGIQPPGAVLADEPDTGLSPRSARYLAKLYSDLGERGIQVIAACHHPYVIASAPEVLSVEHRRWMPSDEFLRSHEADHAP